MHYFVKKYTLCFLLMFMISKALVAQDLTGVWHGNLEIQGMDLRISFNFSQTGNQLTATMDVPQQGAKGIPMSVVAFENKNLFMSLTQAGIEFKGMWKSDESVEGTFFQSGMSFPLNLSRKIPEIKKINRPQEPKPPFDYLIKDVKYENKVENFTLGGTLTLPKGNGPFPVVVLISGSGQQDRNSEIFGHKPFWVIADYLTQNGFAVLRSDDRGVGSSGGQVEKATSLSFSQDVISALDYLKTLKEIQPKKMFLMGHSEGGMIAPLVVEKYKDVAGIILLAAPGIPGDLLLEEQSYLIGKASGLSEETLIRTRQTNQKIYQLIKTETDESMLINKISAILEVEFESLEPNQRKTAIQNQMSSISSPWFKYFINFDPEPILKKVSCPVLVLNGANDLQVPAVMNLEGIQNALNKGGNKKATFKTYPKLNHLFQESVTGNVSEYGTIEETFNKAVLLDILNWLKSQNVK